MLGKTIADLETGDVFKPIRYVLTELMCTEYAHGMEDTAEWYYSAYPPFDRQVRPPSMVHADKMRLLEENCDLERRIANVHTDDARIHYEYDAVQHSPAFVGEELVVTGGIVEHYEKRGGDYLHYWLRVETADGRLVTTYEDRTLLSYKPKAGESK
ncbi:MAG: MaoC family dehydratase N-terminal domain-containing protein [Propionibacteriaceae bacterium]|nr:MaoC family dehydratase N-terminal domain-containing protein [Propionibacteriaceae bacterium]